MADYIARGGWSIKAINRDVRDCYRVEQHGYIVGAGYCYSVEELQELLARHGLDLADLVEDAPECE